MIRKPLRSSKLLSLLVLFLSGLLPLMAAAEVSDCADAVAIGKENINRLVNRSYHYHIEYDTVICLPVYSKFINRNDFYLLYFLKNDGFQAEVEIDKVSGGATLLSYGVMPQPYVPMYDLSFNYSYFDPDSVLTLFRKQRPIQEIDSARLVYFGIIPKLGKRGALWEIFAYNGPYYFSFLGKEEKLDDLIDEVNLKKTEFGNPTADSIRILDLEREVARLGNLTDEEIKQIPDLTREKIDSLLIDYQTEIDTLLSRNRFRWPGKH